MRLRQFLCYLACLSSAALLLGASAPAKADGKGQVRAAMVYNIMRFIRFPSNPDAIRLCALARDDTASDLRALDGRSVGGASIDVVMLASPDSIGASCNVVYLDSAAASSIGSRHRGQVLIGSGRNFAENGGTVGLISFGDQIRFVVNDRTARSAGVRFSSQLLQLAARVIS